MDEQLIAFFTIPILLLGLTGCATTEPHRAQQPLFHHFKPDQIESVNLEAIFSKTKFDGNDNKIGHPLIKSDSHRILAAQIRDREKPHLHENHDLLVYLYRGRGAMKTPKHTTNLTAGDWTSVNRRVPHQFINNGNRPARAIVIRTPSPDGKDYQKLESLK